jgi:hypothetical protein
MTAREWWPTIDSWNWPRAVLLCCLLPFFDNSNRTVPSRLPPRFDRQNTTRFAACWFQLGQRFSWFYAIGPRNIQGFCLPDVRPPLRAQNSGQPQHPSWQRLAIRRLQRAKTRPRQYPLNPGPPEGFAFRKHNNAQKCHPAISRLGETRPRGAITSLAG